MPAQIVAALGVGLAVVLGAMGLCPPFRDTMEHWTYNMMPTKLLDPTLLVMARRRGAITQAQYSQGMRYQGFREDRAEQFFNLSEWMPGVDDLISWSVREAFRDDFAKKWGSDEDYPAKLDEFSGKIGVKPEFLKYAWRSHWELPSVMMGYEMLHREIIDEDELQGLMRALDIMPGWRERLTKLSYNMVTRVDLRRMFRVGLINKEDVEKRYRAMGYSPEDAKLMTDWTEKEEGPPATELTKAQVLNGYKDGLLTEAQAREYLALIGVIDRDIDFYLDTANLDIDADTLKENITGLHDGFVAGIITRETMVSELGSLNLLDRQIQTLMGKADRARRGTAKSPPKETLSRWLKRGTITETQYRDRMFSIGYSKEDIEVFVTESGESNSETEKTPTKADFCRWLKKARITEEEFRTRMGEQGYAPWAIDLYIEDSATAEEVGEGVA